MKIIIKWKEKGWFKALGLHHGSLAAAFIYIGHVLGIGDYAAVAAVFWYLRQETYYAPYFEILDFLLPFLIAFTYMLYKFNII